MSEQVEVHLVVLDQRVERCRLLPIVIEFPDRNAGVRPSRERRRLPDEQQAVGVGVGQRLEQHAANHAEHGGVRSNAEAQREHGKHREQTIAPERADGEPDVLKQEIHGCAPFVKELSCRHPTRRRPRRLRGDSGGKMAGARRRAVRKRTAPARNRAPSATIGTPGSRTTARDRRRGNPGSGTLSMKDVVIVGAGPVGLACAIEAQRAGSTACSWTRARSSTPSSVIRWGWNSSRRRSLIEIGGHPFPIQRYKPTREGASSTTGWRGGARGPRRQAVRDRHGGARRIGRFTVVTDRGRVRRRVTS